MTELAMELAKQQDFSFLIYQRGGKALFVVIKSFLVFNHLYPIPQRIPPTPYDLVDLHHK